MWLMLVLLSSCTSLGKPLNLSGAQVYLPPPSSLQDGEVITVRVLQTPQNILELSLYIPRTQRNHLNSSPA